MANPSMVRKFIWAVFDQMVTVWLLCACGRIRPAAASPRVSCREGRARIREWTVRVASGGLAAPRPYGPVRSAGRRGPEPEAPGRELAFGPGSDQHAGPPGEVVQCDGQRGVGDRIRRVTAFSEGSPHASDQDAVA